MVCPTLPAGTRSGAVLFLLLSLLWSLHVWKWRMLRQMADGVVGKYGGGDARLNKLEFENYVKKHALSISEHELNRLFKDSDDTGDAQLDLGELVTLLTSSEFSVTLDDAIPEASPQRFKSGAKFLLSEAALWIAVVGVVLFLWYSRMESLELQRRSAGWLKLAEIVRKTAVPVGVLKNRGVTERSGVMAEVFTDADASRVFKLVRRLDAGEGASSRQDIAQVWECTELGKDITWAVKRFRVDSQEKRSAVRRELNSEILPLAKRLKHEHIVKYEDWCVEVMKQDGTVEINVLLEFLPGASLHDLVYKRRVTESFGYKRALLESEAQRLLRPVADALRYLHELDEPILHLDLNPSNVRVSMSADAKNIPCDVKVKLIDFGCARKLSVSRRKLSSSSTASSTETEQGERESDDRNLTYLAPEQLMGRSDQRTDVFLFGELLYTCLLATHPFGDWVSASNSDQHMAAFKHNLKNGRFNRPAGADFRQWEHLTTEAQNLLQKCLQGCPDDRPQSMRELMEDSWWQVTDPPAPKQAVAKPMLW